MTTPPIRMAATHILQLVCPLLSYLFLNVLLKTRPLTRFSSGVELFLGIDCCKARLSANMPSPPSAALSRGLSSSSAARAAPAPPLSSRSRSASQTRTDKKALIDALAEELKRAKAQAEEEARQMIEMEEQVSRHRRGQVISCDELFRL